MALDAASALDEMTCSSEAPQHMRLQPATLEVTVIDDGWHTGDIKQGKNIGAGSEVE
jgi:hypothetical protein